MANYKLTFHFMGGDKVHTSATQKPEDITDFIESLTGTDYQAFLYSSNDAYLVNMKNVTHVDIKKL